MKLKSRQNARAELINRRLLTNETGFSTLNRCSGYHVDRVVSQTSFYNFFSYHGRDGSSGIRKALEKMHVRNGGNGNSDVWRALEKARRGDKEAALFLVKEVRAYEKELEELTFSIGEFLGALNEKETDTQKIRKMVDVLIHKKRLWRFELTPKGRKTLLRVLKGDQLKWLLSGAISSGGGELEGLIKEATDRQLKRIFAVVDKDALPTLVDVAVDVHGGERIARIISEELEKRG